MNKFCANILSSFVYFKNKNKRDRLRKQLLAKNEFNKHETYVAGEGLWRSYDQVQCIFSSKRKQTINIILPAITKHMSAGPLSILMFGVFLLKNFYNVRIVVLSGKSDNEIADNMLYQSDEITHVAKCFEYCILTKTLECTEKDIFVGTLFNTAHIASNLAKQCINKKFIYFIQDDERMFFSASSLRVVAESSYCLDYLPIFSTKILQKHFIANDIGGIAARKIETISQGCPSNCYLPEFKTFLARKRKKFVMYARPHIDRNCFDLCMYIVNKACELGIFDETWDIYGFGHPSGGRVKLANGKTISFLTNVSLDEYKKSLYTYDVAMSLMATPHPSMPPIDLALSGCVVVTNNYGCKKQEFLKDICKNILSYELDVCDILKGLGQAIELSKDLNKRYDNACQGKWPRKWSEAFDESHLKWLQRNFVI